VTPQVIRDYDVVRTVVAFLRAGEPRQGTLVCVREPYLIQAGMGARLRRRAYARPAYVQAAIAAVRITPLSPPNDLVAFSCIPVHLLSPGSDPPGSFVGDWLF
jgi:hypothetical protein